MWSSALLLGICVVCAVSYQIGKMKGWDEWDEQNNLILRPDKRAEDHV